MAVIDETKVRELAYRLWENDGRPSGKDDDYWHAAKNLLADEGEDTEPTAAVSVLPVIPLPAGLK